MPYLELPHCKLHYEIDDHTDPWTRPDTVLFVHGFTESTEAWRAWVPHFSRRYRVVRIDQRGFGQSGPLPRDFPLTTELFVDDLARVIGTDTARRGKAVFEIRPPRHLPAPALRPAGHPPSAGIPCSPGRSRSTS